MAQVAAASVLIAVLTGLAAVGSYGFAWYSWRKTSHPVSDRFALLMVADGSWALFAFLEMVSPTDAIALLWATPLAFSAAMAAVFWFLFVVAYTGDAEWIPDATGRVLVGEGVLYGLVHLLNPGGLVYSDVGVAQFGAIRLPYEVFGPILVGQFLFVYVLLLVSFFLLGRFFVRTRNLYRQQTGIILATTLVVMLGNVAFFAGLTPHPRLDLTPLSFAVQAVGVGFALYYYDFLKAAPMAANTMLEEMSDPVFVIDMDQHLIDWNEAASRYVPDVSDPTLSSVANDNSMVWSAAIDGLDEAIVTDGSGTTVTDPEVTTTCRDEGRVRSITYDVRTTDLTDRYDTLRGAVVVLRDVTERQERKRALESQNERLEEFTGIVSHDLRNPLQIIDGKLMLARETGDLSHLDDAADAVARMETMIDDLLRLAREGDSIDETESVSLDAASRAAWDRLQTPAATLRIETDQSVIADADRLTQAFENLFRNSVEHGSTGSRMQSDDSVEHGSTSSRSGTDDAVEHGGSEVTVTVGEFDEGIYVADDGPGIPEEEREEIFDFGTTHSEDGTGIGLAIVDRIVDAHGWDITVTESEHGGARFEITPTRTGVLKDR